MEAFATLCELRNSALAERGTLTALTAETIDGVGCFRARNRFFKKDQKTLIRLRAPLR